MLYRPLHQTCGASYVSAYLVEVLLLLLLLLFATGVEADVAAIVILINRLKH